MILVMYYCQTALAETLNESTDGPAGQPTDNPPSSDWLVDFLRTLPNMVNGIYLWPRPPIGEQFGTEPDLDAQWKSGTAANTHIE